MIVEDLSFDIDPDRLLVVSFVDRDGTPRDVLAITCRYVTATDSTGASRIAVEVLHDPSTPAPVAAYRCPPGRVRRLLIPPARVHAVRPYRE